MALVVSVFLNIKVKALFSNKVQNFQNKKNIIKYDNYPFDSFLCKHHQLLFIPVILKLCILIPETEL